MPFLIPIVAIVMGIGLTIYSLYLRNRRHKEYHERYMAAIEKGMDPPPLLTPHAHSAKVSSDSPTADPSGIPTQALTLLLIGSAFLLAQYIHTDLWGFTGLILIAIGLAKILSRNS